MTTKKTNQGGFTLVELAIVLVIIGLIVGGVLVGQDLIKAATIRATVTDIEKYNAAATTFRGKYTGYPGDLVGTKAAEFGFFTGAARDAAAPLPGQGDGNGLVEGGDPTTSGELGFETALFWVDLSKAGLIPTRTILDGTTAVAQAGDNPTLGGGILPRAKLRDSALFTIYSKQGRNYYAISTFKAAAGVLTYAPGVTPLEARGIDEKLDDGVPLSGVVQAVAQGVTSAGTTPNFTYFTPVADTRAAADGCVIGASDLAATYNGATDAALNNIACSLQVRTSF